MKGKENQSGWAVAESDMCAPVTCLFNRVLPRDAPLSITRIIKPFMDGGRREGGVHIFYSTNKSSGLSIFFFFL